MDGYVILWRDCDGAEDETWPGDIEHMVRCVTEIDHVGGTVLRVTGWRPGADAPDDVAEEVITAWGQWKARVEASTGPAPRL